MNEQMEKFAKAILDDCVKNQPQAQQPVVAKMTPHFKKGLIGTIVLLAINSLVFTGAMIPAMWELTSLIWIMVCIRNGVAK